MNDYYKQMMSDAIKSINSKSSGELWEEFESFAISAEKHPKCKGYMMLFTGDYDCAYNTNLSCEECKYGVGRKDPEAKCNQL
jgi:hypothetical protein